MFTFRKLKPIDSLIYREIRLECLKNFPEAFGAKYEDQVLLQKLKFQQFIEEEHQTNIVFGIFTESKLIGICAIVPHPKRDGVALLIQMYVKPSESGKKAGQKLLMFVLENIFASYDYSEVELEVKKDNERAFHVYEKFGFTLSKSNNGMNPEDDTTFVMEMSKDEFLGRYKK